jgi:hypothetical protein
MLSLVTQAEPRKPVVVRFSAAGVDKVDELRGAWTRSEYIRRAVAYAAKNGMKGPREVNW